MVFKFHPPSQAPLTVSDQLEVSDVMSAVKHFVLTFVFPLGFRVNTPN